MRFRKNPPERAAFSVAPAAPAAKEWMPLPVREVYLAQVEMAATTEALDALLRNARQRYLGPSLGDLFDAVHRRRRELQR